MRLLLLLTLPLYLLDQATKFAIVRHFVEGESSNVIPGFFNLARVHNKGIAFGNFSDKPFANTLFTVVALSALAAIIFYWLRGAFAGRLNGVAVALLVSGILGNLTDRLIHGYVVDFLDFFVGDWHWYTFNIADSCICIAAGLLFISAFRTPEEDPRPSADNVETEAAD